MPKTKKVKDTTNYDVQLEIELPDSVEKLAQIDQAVDIEIEKYKDSPFTTCTEKTLKVRLVSPNAQLPKRVNPTDAGADLFATHELVIGANDSKFMDLGIQIEIPNGMAGFIFARSGLGSKGVRPRNCVGVIDSKYRDNVGIMIENNSNNTIRISTGDRIAQLVLMPVYCLEIEQVDSLDMTDNRCGGFGHSGM